MISLSMKMMESKSSLRTWAFSLFLEIAGKRMFLYEEIKLYLRA